MASAKLVFGLSAIATTLMAPGLAIAQTCTSDADCAKGLSCQEDPTIATAAVVCSIVDGGTVCTEVVGPQLPATKSCQAAPCASDADCGPDMVCFSQTYTTCTGGTPETVRCEPGTECPDPPVPDPVTCADTTVSYCAYRWEMPCNTDADCGAGFTCKPNVIGVCSGSSGSASGGTAEDSVGTGGASGSSEPPAPPSEGIDAGEAPVITCTTVESYPGYCQANAVACAADSDCPSGWTCVTVHSGTEVSSTPPDVETAPSGAGEATSKPEPVPVPPPVVLDAGALFPPEETTRTCQPPSSHGPLYVGTDLGGSEGGGTTAVRAADAGTSQGNAVPPTPTPTTADMPGNTPQTTAATTSGGGGCTVAAGELSSGPAWLLFAALGLLFARRRRKG
ncbi:MAG: hypothetical protein JXP73_05065 [Deltaproteobacteria bacterium]|nr:hypothetical protein [Deltaproteobacteria bacterium]